jgi:hypothetical protein
VRSLAVLLVLIFPASAGAAPMAFGGPTGRRALTEPWMVRGRTVHVPYVVNAHDLTSLESYRGAVATYRTTFSLRGAGDYALRFESVNHRARVWVDGRVVARHTGAYLPFEVRLPLRAGPHRLAVRADWRGPEKMRAAGWFRSWFNFGGIDREVTIRRLGRSELDAPGIVTHLDDDRVPTTAITLRVRNRAHRTRAIKVRGTLGRAALRFPPTTLAPNRTAWITARVRLPHTPLWSPEHPALQTLRVSEPGQPGYVARVGLREIAHTRDGLYLNGRRIQLRGASIQEDARGRGDALTTHDMDGIVARLKRIHANATRAQHALSPALLERLDAAGILVWQGVAPFDVPGRFAADTEAARAKNLRRVRLDVLDARAHPSILTWNLVNELSRNGATKAQRTHVIRAAKVAKRLDPGRPTAVDVWGTHLPADPGPLYDAVDLIGATDYEGWYANPLASPNALRANTREWLRHLHALFPRKPLFITEFGAEANTRNPTHAPGGLAFQARLLARHIDLYKADPHVSGMLIWSLDDFALRPNFLGGSIRGLLPGIALQRGINAKGLFTYGGRAKPAVAVVARRFR